MKRVTGIGGIFFKANDPEQLRDWYAKHLQLPKLGGTVFKWRDQDDPKCERYTVRSPFEASTDYFEPSKKPYMINFIVENLDATLDQLRGEGVTVADRRDESEFGKFGWIMDPEGNRIELSEPPAQTSET
jgi:predicted enzyme related to lactoylglutathione lyase